ncbi:MAG: hypothetical protein JRE58_05295 [Deltaproteobacteria bacterium]|nr:hypothetical protein [Deltaproteobacteria bacterium]
MTDTVDNIKQRMKELEVLIRETKKRLPAHSIKPPVMMDLLEYEDEYDILLDKLKTIKNNKSK